VCELRTGSTRYLAGKEVDFAMIFSEAVEQENKMQVEKVGSELYAMLSSLVTGEAMTVLRGVMTGDGWLARAKLNARFDPRIPAKALMAMLTVMNPKNCVPCTRTFLL
jgi:hypothetical protein